MHIAFNGWFWDRPNAGSGQYIRRLLTGLRRIAPELALSLVLPPHIHAADELPPDVEVIHTKGMGGNLGKVIFEQHTYPRVVGQIKADIAHVPYWGAPLSSPARLVTSVLDVIGLVLPEYTQGFLPHLYTSLVSATARGSAHIITLSEAAKVDIIKHLDVPADLVTAIPLAADEVFHPRIGAEHDAAVREKYDLPDSFILYLGGFDSRKQLSQLIEAFTFVYKAEGDLVSLVIAGREPQWGSPLFPDIRKLAEEYELGDAIRWIGYVDEADKPSLYRLARVFAFPSRYEGFGLPVLEAMASGTPVVANNIPSIAEVVGEGAYLVEEGNDRAMAGALLALLGQDMLREGMIGAGLARATQFQWRKTARETLAIYEHVMSLP